MNRNDNGQRSELRAGERIDDETGEIIEEHLEPDEQESGVTDERDIPSVNRARSLKARVSNVMAMVLMVALGGGFLVWYYSTAFSKMAKEDEQEKQSAANRAAGEMRVPPLGRIDPPKPTEPASPPVTDAEPELFVPPQPMQPTGANAQQGPAQPTPEELARQRRLQAPVLAGGQVAAVQAAAQEAQGAAIPASLDSGFGAPGGASKLEAMLKPTPTPAVQAKMLPTMRYLLPKGDAIDCTNLTAVDSTYDGLVTCIGATDVYSADGSLVLLEAGTKYVGEKRGDIKRGQGRVFVLWNEARTPTGVIVDLASPGTDELGRAGLPGFVDTHFWDRFGAAILISVIDGTVQAIANAQTSSNGDGTTVQFNPNGSGSIMTEILKNTVDVPPTVVKNQGERIQIMVARDVDFRSVYELRRR